MKIFFILLALALSSTLFSREMSLPDIVKMAIERSLEIRSEEQAVKTSDFDKQQAGKYGNPNFIIQSGRLHSGDSTGGVIDLTVMQPFLYPGKRQNHVELQEAILQVRQTELEHMRLNLQHQVALLSIKLAAMKELRKHSEERKSRFALLERYFKTRPIVSPKQLIEQSIIENQLRLIAKNIINTDNEIQTLSRELRYWLKSDEEINPLVDWHKIHKAPMDALSTDMIMGHNLDLKRKTFEIKQAETKLKLAESLKYPDFQLGLNYRQELVDPANHFYHAQVGFTLPIFDTGNVQVQKEKVNIMLEKNRKTILEQTLEKAKDQAIEELALSEKILDVFSYKILLDSEKSLALADSEFKKGRIDTNLFLQTDTQIHETLDTFFMSYYQHVSVLSKLFMLKNSYLEL